MNTALWQDDLTWGAPWRYQLDRDLRKVRLRAIAKGEWPYPPNTPLPKPAWLVEDRRDPKGIASILNERERLVLRAARGLEAAERQRRRGRSAPQLFLFPATARDWAYQVRIDRGSPPDWAEEDAASRPNEWRREVKTLIAKQVLAVGELAQRTGPRTKTKYFIRDFDTALKRLRAQPDVFSDAEGNLWTSGPGKRLLMPAEGEAWLL